MRSSTSLAGISRCRTSKPCALTARVRNLTNVIYAQWADPGLPDQVLLGAPRTYEIAASAKW